MICRIWYSSFEVSMLIKIMKISLNFVTSRLCWT